MLGLRPYRRGRKAMITKGFVLLSGGIDSSTVLAHAIRDLDAQHVTAISIDYGQRHHREIQAAKKVAEYFDVAHEVHLIPGMPNVMLTNPDAEVPNISYKDIVGVSPTYVPFRNGQLISKIAAIAQHRVNQEIEAYEQQFGVKPVAGSTLDWNARIYFGAHAEDAAGDAYPDCRLDFVGAMGAAVYIGTYHAVRLSAPLIEMNKAEIIRHGQILRVPYGLTWSCYKGERLQCGTCPTCRARRDGFIEAGVKDPTEYASEEVVI